MPERNTAWVVKESRLISYAENVITSLPELRRVKVLHPSELNDVQFFETIILIGSPIWFSDSIFTAPKAKEIRIISYAWMKDTWKLQNVFIEPYKLISTRCWSILNGTRVVRDRRARATRR